MHKDKKPPYHLLPSLGPPLLEGRWIELQSAGSGIKSWTRNVLDRAAAVVMLMVSLPVLLAAMLLVKCTSRGPIIYRQVRLGLHRRPFAVFKLRTMRHDCEQSSGARWATKDDPRRTPVGGFLRAMHIDELPQLWNVIRGDMSLVGPRPERPEIIAHLEPLLPRYSERLSVLPGLTGLAQVQLPPDTDLGSVRRKLRYDLHSIENASLFLDVRIVLATIVHVLHLPFGLSRMLLRIPDAGVVEPAADSWEETSLRPQSVPEGS